MYYYTTMYAIIVKFPIVPSTQNHSKTDRIVRTIVCNRDNFSDTNLSIISCICHVTASYALEIIVAKF